MIIVLALLMAIPVVVFVAFGIAVVRVCLSEEEESL